MTAPRTRLLLHAVAADPAPHLEVDFIACDGRGICAEVLPGRITLDDWGYPIIDPTPLTGDDLALARRAVRLCPKLALRLVAPGP